MSSSRLRRRNSRGQGGQLRDDIVTAARELLTETGSAHAVTLRAVARQVGIAAPSIYAHFDGPEQIVDAVVAQTFADFAQYLDAAREGLTDPRERLVACCQAYLAFGAQQPALYQLAFSQPLPMSEGRNRDPDAAADSSSEQDSAKALARVRSQTGSDTFSVFVTDVTDAIAAGVSDADDALSTATALWVSLHGLIVLRDSAPWFPWPDPHKIETELITRVAALRPAST